MRFNYQARSKDGKLHEGAVDAINEEHAAAELQKKDLYVTRLEEAGEGILQSIKVLERVTKKDIVLFFRQLSIMFKAGIPIVESLDAVAKQADKSKFKEQISQVTESVKAGSSLSRALEDFPETFSPFCLGIVKSGESTGKLSESLDYLANHLERDYNFSKKVVSSMIYPAFVVMVFIGVIFFIALFVIPQLGEMFYGMDVPLLTQIVLGISEWLLKWWWLFFGMIAGIAVAFWQFFKTDMGKEAFDVVIFKTPILKDFFKKLNLVSVAENLSTLLASNLPVVKALESTADVLTSSTYKKIILETKEEVKNGENISKNLVRYPDYFPPLFVQMIMVGEKTGRIDTSLENVVSFYKKEIDRALEELVKLLEPIMIIFLGFFVAILVISILMPIYQLQI